MQACSLSGKSSLGHYPRSSYMPLQTKTNSPFYAPDEKQRRWGCCRISIALISLVFFVAFVITVVYVVIFTDLFHHLNGTQPHAQNSTDDVVRVNGSFTGMESSLKTVSQVKELNILVLIVDTRSHIMDNNSYKATLDIWRKTEATWRDLYEGKAIADRLTVTPCQTCRPAGIKNEDNMPTVFYTVEHFKGDTHSFNTVVFVALPTPPGEVLAVLKRHGRTDGLGQICQKGSWSSTGCDFKVANEQDTLEKRAHYKFAIQVPVVIELELLKFNKTIVMQKDIDTFKILINQPMAIR